MFEIIYLNPCKSRIGFFNEIYKYGLLNMNNRAFSNPAYPSANSNRSAEVARLEQEARSLELVKLVSIVRGLLFRIVLRSSGSIHRSVLRN